MSVYQQLKNGYRMPSQVRTSETAAPRGPVEELICRENIITRGAPTDVLHLNPPVLSSSRPKAWRRGHDSIIPIKHSSRTGSIDSSRGRFFAPFSHKHSQKRRKRVQTSGTRRRR
ncbi:hypothetical protein FS842_004032 [Serendipita sp. 407]|nr:hypothetical protein FS842_004032 [Serendipita sp. 407]